MLLVAATAACGVKGPPRPPVRIVPARILAPEFVRMGDRVYLEFAVPAADTDGSSPADIERVEVYAVTTQPTERRPTEAFSEDWLEAATLVATLPVRPPGMEVPRRPSDEDETDADADSERDEGDDAIDDGFVGQGDLVTVVERLTPETLVPVKVGDEDEEDEEEEDRDDDEPDRVIPMPYLPPPLPMPSVRSYVAFGVSSRGRDGDPSVMVAVPLVTPPDPPAPATASYDGELVEIAWEEPVGGIRQPVQDDEPSEDGLASSPILEGLEASAYVLFDVAAADDPDRDRPPTVTNPRDETSYTDTDVEFGDTKCYAVRVLDFVGAAEIMGDASPATCLVLTDTFVPAAPRGLLAVSDDESINLVWDDNSEDDIAGYVVLRGLASDATLQPLTLEPVVDPTYRDSDVVAGERYSYQVMAVDDAVPPNESPPSAAITETAR